MDVDTIQKGRNFQQVLRDTLGKCELMLVPHIVERVLNHTSGATGGLVGVYQRYEYLDERKEALNAWGECVDRIVHRE